MNPRARITRVTMWRVRVHGHPVKYFADEKYGGEDAALAAAQAWRDARWNGEARPPRKVSAAQRAEIIASEEPVSVLAERYGVSRQYVYNLKSRARRG